MTKVEYDLILVVYDRLTKYSYFILYNKKSTAEDIAYRFLKNIFANYKMLYKIITNRGS